MNQAKIRILNLSRHKSDCDDSYPDDCIPSPPPDLDCGDHGVPNNIKVEGDDHMVLTAMEMAKVVNQILQAGVMTTTMTDSNDGKSDKQDKSNNEDEYDYEEDKKNACAGGDCDDSD